MKQCEAPRPQAGASRQGIIIHIAPLHPAYKGGACGARSGQMSKFKYAKFGIKVFDIDLIFACLREAASAKAGHLNFGFVAILLDLREAYEYPR